MIYFPFSLFFSFFCSPFHSIPFAFQCSMNQFDVILYIHQYGRTALIMCAMYGNATVLELLCKRGADTSVIDEVCELSYSIMFPHIGYIIFFTAFLWYVLITGQW